MSCQDRLGRVNRVNSDVTMELIPHQAGRDALDDPTDTGYGGLRHLAPYEGSWAADNGVLDLKSNKNQGIVVSTFVADALCGSAQNGFLLAYTDKGEYGGLAFRVYDKDNLYYVAYFADDDVIKLIKRVGGSETTLSESAAMSWTIDGDNWYYLRIRVHYNHLYVYTSTDGVTWTALSWDSGDGELPGYSASSSGDDLEVWAGRFGIVGYGYSDDDSWDDWTPTPWPGPVTEPSNWGVIVTCKEYVGRSFNFFETEQDVIWQDITGAMAGHQIIRLEVGKQGQAYCTTDYGIFYTSSITARTVKWNCIQTLAAMRSETGFANAMFQAVDISDGGTAYFPVHEWTYVLGGYYSGNAGGLSYTQFTQKVASCNLHASTNGATWCAQLYGGSYYMGVYMGGCGGSRYCVDGAVSDQYPQDQGIRVFKDGFCSTETGDFYGAFSTSEYYSGKTLQGYVGIDVLGGVPLWQADDHYLYKGQSAICEIDAVLGGTTAGRAIYSRNNAGEIIMVNYQRIHQGMSPMRPVVVWTDSDFVNWTDKTGNWLSAIGEFTDPASGYRGNATAICFGYDESERR